jgi:pilus assembly protein Flp/PilA
MKRWVREDGQGLVEYALILVLIAIVIVVALTLMGGTLASTYARIIGGVNGQVITGSGHEFVVAGYDQTHSSGGGTCTITFTNITIIALLDGSANKNASVSVPVSVDGVGQAPISATTNNNGIAQVASAGPYSAACPMTVNIGGRSITID